KLLISHRFFDRVQIRTLYVFDDGQFERGSVVDLAHQDRDIGEAGALRGAPAAFARNDLVLTWQRSGTHDDGLHDAVLADRLRQIGKVLVAKTASRIARIRRD